MRFVAAAAKDSSLIRIFRVEDSSLFKELRKQYCIGPIVSLSFDTNSLTHSSKSLDSIDGSTEESRFLMASDRMGNVEVFYTKEETQATGSRQTGAILSNRVSVFSFLGDFFPYFESEWSFANYKNYEEKRDPIS